MLAQEGAPALPVALGCRRDAGASTLRTSVAETLMPSLRSSPMIRAEPQLVFSRASRRISFRTSRSIGGRPGRRCGNVQRRATRRRCQRSSVSGRTGNALQEQRGQTRLRAASMGRSRGSNCGRPTGGGSPARAAARESRAPSNDRPGRAAAQTPAAGRRRATNEISKDSLQDGNADASASSGGPLRQPDRVFAPHGRPRRSSSGVTRSRSSRRRLHRAVGSHPAHVCRCPGGAARSS